MQDLEAQLAALHVRCARAETRVERLVDAATVLCDMSDQMKQEGLAVDKHDPSCPMCKAVKAMRAAITASGVPA